MERSLFPRFGLADFASGGRLGVVDRSLGGFENTLRLTKVNLPGTGGCHRARGPLKELDSEPLLSRLDLLTHGLLSDVELVRSGCEAPQLRHFDEVAHLSEVGAGHAERCSPVAATSQAQLVEAYADRCLLSARVDRNIG